MKRVNIAYDYDYDEETEKTVVNGKVDIIELPDEIVKNIDCHVQNFFDWAADKTNGCFHFDTALKRDVCQIVSADFVRYINNELKMQAKVIEANVDYNPNLPIVEFWFSQNQNAIAKSKFDFFKQRFWFFDFLC